MFGNFGSLDWRLDQYVSPKEYSLGTSGSVIGSCEGSVKKSTPHPSNNSKWADHVAVHFVPHSQKLE